MDNTIGVPSTVLTQAQVNILYEILRRFDIIAYKSDLNYSIACGTALGAVLRGGLIPWDDDADLFARSDLFYEKLPALMKNSENALIIRRYTRWSDGRGWYKIYHPAVDYPNIDLYLLEFHDNIWRPSDREISGRTKMYLNTDQIYISDRILFGPLSLPIFSYPTRFLDRYYGIKWRYANTERQANTNQKFESDRILDFRPVLPIPIMGFQI